MIKQEDIKKQKRETLKEIRRLTKERNRLIEKHKKLDHDNQILGKQLVEIYDTNIISYTKKDLLEALSFLKIPKVLNQIICDYVYDLKYKKYSCYKLPKRSKHMFIGSDFELFGDYVVERVDDILYISNILTGKILDVHVSNKIDTGKYFQYAFGNLYTHNNNRAYKFVFENERCNIVKEDKDESQKIINTRDGKNSCYKMINEKKIKKDLYMLTGKKVTLITDVFNVDKNNNLSILAHIEYKHDRYNIYQEPYVLEYDLTKKHIIEFYKLETDHILKANYALNALRQTAFFHFNRNHFDITIINSRTGERIFYVFVKGVI